MRSAQCRVVQMWVRNCDRQCFLFRTRTTACRERHGRARTRGAPHGLGHARPAGAPPRAPGPGTATPRATGARGPGMGPGLRGARDVMHAMCAELSLPNYYNY
jgi:hypothetical protein